MNFRRHRRRASWGIDLTPLIDVVFLLLIFFMVSTTFVRESHLRIDLPQASGEPGEEAPGVIEITIDARGEYSVDDRRLYRSDSATLRRALEDTLASGNSLPDRVIITADAQATHQAVVTAMDVAGKVGLEQVRIATRPPESDG